MYSERKYNNAQRARANDSFYDEDAEETTQELSSGSSVPVTNYSDGSSTVHFGGPCGPVDYDENGEEC